MFTKTVRVNPTKTGKMVGPLAGLAISLGLTALAVGHLKFNRLVRHDVAELLALAHPGQTGLITPEMLQDLPMPIQRYLSYTGVVGTSLMQTVYLEQHGKMRPGPKLPWLDLTASQWYTTSPPGFVWAGTLHLGPLPVARARDRYLDGKGNMLIRAAEALPVADAGGAEMDQGAMLRYLGEMIWFPAAFLSDSVSFAPIDDASARVILTDHGHSVQGTLYIDDDGRLSKFVAERYQMVDGGYELHTWSASVTRYATLAGLRLPVGGNAVWHLNGEEFAYFDAIVTELKYDPERHREITPHSRRSTEGDESDDGLSNQF